ncbi:MAG: ATP-dependent metallopeptidase FtsH/Yme1/Tma family protein [Candidatus Falkowbacteria bacterium]|nr:ATP-dependent metallopeptidase FtsH/Yme1/Tma family protein [Candidatus Falkowbacteria bacterium]
MKNILKNIAIFLLIFLAIASLFSLNQTQSTASKNVGIESLINHVNNNEIKSIVVRGSDIEVALKDGKKEIVKKEIGESFSQIVNNYGRWVLAKFNLKNSIKKIKIR